MNRPAIASDLGSEDPERGSLPFLMLVMILSVALGGVLLSTITSQVRTASFNEGRSRALDAAQGGLDHALASIRTAVDSTDGTVGDAGRLPCFGDDSWTPLGPPGTTEFKVVSVEYYRTSPAQMTATARDGAKMSCSESAGTYDRTTSGRAPRFALIKASGRDASQSGPSASTRTLETTYEFQTNDVNVTGGQIRIYPSATSTTPYCMDAGSDDPVVNAPVTLQPCSTSNPPAERQVFAYRSDLSIELVSSIPNPGVAGLCLDSEGTSPAAGSGIVLKRCGAPDANPQRPDDPAVCPVGFTPTTYRAKYPTKSCLVGPYTQRFSVDDNAHLRGANTANDNVSGLCIDVASQAAGTQLRLQSCAGSTVDTRQTWVPSPTAGAGGAGAGNSQIVNYAQFATCIDFTGNSTTAQYQILYTCKQNPNPTAVSWNQKLTPAPALTQAPTLTTLTTGPSGNTFCLITPSTDGGYVTLKTCSSATDAEKKWTVSQRFSTNATDSPELAYRDRYTIKDSTGRCLAPGRNDDLHDNAYYKLVVAPCDGSTAQKWNADPSRLKATLSNLREVS